jgi:hypothetical protein
MTARLLASINAEMKANQERVEIHIGSLASQMNVKQNKLDKVDDGQLEMKGQVGSSASRMHVYQAKIEANNKKAEVLREKCEPVMER